MLTAVAEFEIREQRPSDRDEPVASFSGNGGHRNQSRRYRDGSNASSGPRPQLQQPSLEQTPTPDEFEISSMLYLYPRSILSSIQLTLQWSRLFKLTKAAYRPLWVLRKLQPTELGFKYLHISDIDLSFIFKFNRTPIQLQPALQWLGFNYYCMSIATSIQLPSQSLKIQVPGRNFVALESNPFPGSFKYSVRVLQALQVLEASGAAWGAAWGVNGAAVRAAGGVTVNVVGRQSGGGGNLPV
ncbi:hypothetical protein C8F04DRAFT_1201123 [Mycena alexandri]|uniref:Uncharacterized protein n=1 Tax=Mycena alexandri TaxID=1745969 RepID=A0AAD6RZ83_9AGAR|nr:hypothetical protein C8F04DRAFT_1203385 [Mycena alexandri]KAJ7017065.1 hypothetical protein C8F04DRAFT_1201123 [Mycena alexandri]